MEDKKYNVVILAGGFGSRLKSLTQKKPKPMVNIGNKPLLETHIDLCRRYGFKNILILTHYLPDVIQSYFRDGKDFGVNIDYKNEIIPRGTAGAIHDAIHNLDNHFIIIFGDVFMEIDLKSFFDFHLKKKSQLTPFIHPNDHPQDSDLVELTEDSRIKSINCYPHPNNFFGKNLVTAGLYVADKKIFKIKELKWDAKLEISKDLLVFIINSANKNSFGYISREYAKDMGTPARLIKVRDDFRKGKHIFLSGKERYPAIFLDRDGTIIQDIGHLNEISQIKFIPRSLKAIKKINKSGYASIIITNQPVVARGDITIPELNRVHNYIEFEAGKVGAYFDHIYYCPHHPDRGFVGENKFFKVSCECRKPKTRLAQIAINKYNLDYKASWMIGDTTTDVLFGLNADLKTILLRTGAKGLDKKFKVEPDFTCYDLLEAVDFALGIYPQLKTAVDNFLNLSSLKRFIFIGGLSQSGKSTFASVLHHSLGKKKSHIINLDGFLLNGHSKDSGNHIYDKYDLDKLKKVMSLIKENQQGEILVPIYNRDIGFSETSQLLKFNKNDFFIFEGTIMLSLLKDITASRIYVYTAEKNQKKRFYKEYKWRGRSLSYIASLYSSRDSEFSFIKKNITFDYKFNTDNYAFS
jgi:D,D-heptose 1,7-bisphosphate phosphatase